jgi:hypothetical protein
LVSPGVFEMGKVKNSVEIDGKGSKRNGLEVKRERRAR